MKRKGGEVFALDDLDDALDIVEMRCKLRRTCHEDRGLVQQALEDIAQRANLGKFHTEFAQAEALRTALCESINLHATLAQMGFQVSMVAVYWGAATSGLAKEMREISAHRQARRALREIAGRKITDAYEFPYPVVRLGYMHPDGIVELKKLGVCPFQAYGNEFFIKI